MENFCEGLVIQDDDYSRLLRGIVELEKSRVHNYIKAPTKKANMFSVLVKSNGSLSNDDVDGKEKGKTKQ